jgi:hypothetical protein
MGEHTNAHDIARFDPDAVADEVCAAFVCRSCLRTARAVLIVNGLHGIDALCSCHSCEPRTLVALSNLQLARLRRDPPLGIEFDLVP